MKGPSVACVGWGTAGPGVWPGACPLCREEGQAQRLQLERTFGPCCGSGGLEPLGADAAHLPLTGLRGVCGELQAEPCGFPHSQWMTRIADQGILEQKFSTTHWF